MAKKISKGMIVNQKQLAEILGITRRTLTEWQKKGLPLKHFDRNGGSHEYDTREVIDYLINCEIEKLTMKLPNDSVYNLDQEKARLAHWQANEKEIAVRQLRNELIHISEIALPLRKLLMQLRESILELKHRLVPKLELAETNLDKELTIDDECLNLLEKLSNPEIVDIIESSDDSVKKMDGITKED